jgi:hypothetical protein
VAVVAVNTDHTHLDSTLDRIAGEAATSRGVELVQAEREEL